jgi:protein-arginine kinase
MLNNGSIVVSTRVRLARNINKIPFLQNMDDQTAREVIEKVHSVLSSDFELIELKDLDATDKLILV